MSRYRGPVSRLCRREGMKLYLKGSKCYTKKCPFERRGTPPGQHGIRRRKMSNYGIQLREKQKVRRVYMVNERPFKRYFETAESRPGVTGENLLRLLETRLDNTVYRMGFASSRAQARQLVGHGHIDATQGLTHLDVVRCSFQPLQQDGFGQSEILCQDGYFSQRQSRLDIVAVMPEHVAVVLALL